jgi:hypothetical protein
MKKNNLFYLLGLIAFSYNISNTSSVPVLDYGKAVEIMIQALYAVNIPEHKHQDILEELKTQADVRDRSVSETITAVLSKYPEITRTNHLNAACMGYEGTRQNMPSQSELKNQAEAAATKSQSFEKLDGFSEEERPWSFRDGRMQPEPK